MALLSEGVTQTVETDRLRLRPWREGDLDAFARITADPQVMRYMLRGPLTRAEARAQIERFERERQERGLGHWAVEEGESGTLLGRIGLLHHEDWPEDPENVEVGWLLDRAVWGRGLATEGALASLRYGFLELGLERIISIAHPENRASHRVMEKAGLALQGKRAWRGGQVVWYAIHRSRTLRQSRGSSPPFGGADRAPRSRRRLGPMSRRARSGRGEGAPGGGAAFGSGGRRVGKAREPLGLESGSLPNASA